MKLTYIELPLGEEIDCLWLTSIIAKVTHPTLEEAEGIDCVVGKILQDQNFANYCALPYEMREVDRMKLKPLLADLPKLHGRMNDLEIDTFLYLYSALPNRLSWEPILNSEAHIQKARKEQWDIRAIHLQNLQRRLTDGKIHAFTLQHVPALHIGPNVYIPRDQIIEYLKACGIQIRQDARNFRYENTTASTVQQDATCSTDITQSTADTDIDSGTSDSAHCISVSKATAHKGTQDPWTDDDLRQLFEYHKKLKMQGNKNYTKLTADKFELSTARVRYLLSKKKATVDTKFPWELGLAKQ